MDRRKYVAACTLPLARQVEGADCGTVRRGEHPRDRVGRLDLVSDEQLDRFRTSFPEASDLALDGALLLEEMLETTLAARGLGSDALAKLPRRPILATFACFACGSTVAARASREWCVDRAMRESRLGERDVLAVVALLEEVFHGEGPGVDRFDSAGLLELRGLVGEDFDLAALRDRVGQLLAPRPSG